MDQEEQRRASNLNPDLDVFSRLTKLGRAVIADLNIIDEDKFKFNVERSRLEKLKLVDNFRPLSPDDYGDDHLKFRKLMEAREYAPNAVPRASDRGSSEDHVFSSLYYFSSGDETPEQMDYLREHNWLCKPEELLGEVKNDILDGVDVISIHSSEDYEVKVKDEDGNFDPCTVRWDENARQANNDSGSEYE